MFRVTLISQTILHLYSSSKHYKTAINPYDRDGLQHTSKVRTENTAAHLDFLGGNLVLVCLREQAFLLRSNLHASTTGIWILMWLYHVIRPLGTTREHFEKITPFE